MTEQFSSRQNTSWHSAQIALQLKIDKDWHINSHTPTFDYLIGTTFELQSKEGIILTDVQYPKGNLVSLSFADQPIDVYEGTTTIFASLKISDKLNLGIDTIKGSITFQACNNQICLPPSTIDVNIPIQIVGAGETVTLLNQDLFANYKPIESVQAETKNDIAAMFEAKGSLLTFFAIFLIGLALNLTPCVYPMLSVTVSLFGSQAETKFLQRFLQSYSLCSRHRHNVQRAWCYCGAWRRIIWKLAPKSMGAWRYRGFVVCTCA